MKSYKLIKCFVLSTIVLPVVAKAQEVFTDTAGNPLPLPPPSILQTNTAVGFVDAFLKAFPFLWSAFLGPITIGYIRDSAPKLLEKTPKKLYPVISAVIGSLGGLFAGLASLMMEGGGVAIDTGMINGAGTGAAVQTGIQVAGPKIAPILTEEKKG